MSTEIIELTEEQRLLVEQHSLHSVKEWMLMYWNANPGWVVRSKTVIIYENKGFPSVVLSDNELHIRDIHPEVETLAIREGIPYQKRCTAHGCYIPAKYPKFWLDRIMPDLMERLKREK